MGTHTRTHTSLAFSSLFSLFIALPFTRLTFTFTTMSLCNYWSPSDLTELKRVFDELDGGSRRTSDRGSNLPSNKSTGIFVPRMDLVEQSDSHTLVVELPGYKKDAVSISLGNTRLTISGEADRSQEHERGQVKVSERNFGHFSRSIAVPPGLKSSDGTLFFLQIYLRSLKLTCCLP